MAGENIVHIEGDNWQTEVMESEVPVIVDFWAEWCGPCRAVAPVLDEISDEMVGRLKVAKVDVDANQKLASDYGIRNIPSLLVVKDGEVKEQMVGAMNAATLREKLLPYV